MYNWLFFKIYNFYKYRNNHDPLLNSASLVFFAQGVHFFLFLLVFKSIVGFDIPKFSSDNSENKLAFMPISFLWFIIVYIYYENKLKQEIKSIPEPKILKLYELLILIFMVIFIPLYFIIKLSGGQIWK